MLERVSTRIRTRGEEESGFTLVELLVVMLILGILAAIAIPSFFNQRDKATDADAKASVRTAQTAMETYATDNSGSYLNATPTILKGIETTLNDSDLAVDSATSNSYKITVTSDNDSEGANAMKFSISRAGDGTSSLTCVVVAKDGCPTGGNWG